MPWPRDHARIVVGMDQTRPVPRLPSSAPACASTSVSPSSTTVAPYAAGRRTFTSGVVPASRWWRHAEPCGVIGHRLRVIAGRHRDHAAARSSASGDSLLSAPRSLNELVTCKFSYLTKISAPVSSDDDQRRRCRRMRPSRIVWASSMSLSLIMRSNPCRPHYRRPHGNALDFAAALDWPVSRKPWRTNATGSA